MNIRPAQPGDRAAWQRLRGLLWPDPENNHAADVAAFFSDQRKLPLEVLLAFDGDKTVGFAELSIRPYAEGCAPGRVAFLEGWFVEESFRRRGIGAALVKAAEDWGRAQGCVEFASDTNVDNTYSVALHGKLGFEEVERIVCFRKTL